MTSLETFENIGTSFFTDKESASFFIVLTFRTSGPLLDGDPLATVWADDALLVSLNFLRSYAHSPSLPILLMPIAYFLSFLSAVSCQHL